MSMTRKIAAFGVLSLILTVITALALIVPPPGGGNALEAAYAKAEAGGAVTAGTDTAAVENAGGAGALAADPLAADELAAHEGDLTSAEEESKKYILKNVSGYIGIFAADDMDQPVSITDIPVAKLRTADAQMLETGIAVMGGAALARILEDFGS